MTPAEQRAEKLAKKFGTTIRHPLTAMGKTKEVIHENGCKIEGFSAGFLAFKDQPEVLALVEALEIIVYNNNPNLTKYSDVGYKALAQWKKFVDGLK